ncbi:hypothetical protein A2U01_0052760, partial [Trifolium medium]|nr:hypothetical protein [Trifolium medium]
MNEAKDIHDSIRSVGVRQDVIEDKQEKELGEGAHIISKGPQGFVGCAILEVM